MKLRGFLIVVDDIEASRRFYEDVFGLETIQDNDGNMVPTDGVFLQDRRIWVSVGYVATHNSSSLMPKLYVDYVQLSDGTHHWPMLDVGDVNKD
ncbi:MAG: VOC family protein, partial [Candidatus Methanomethylophilaceae archaeon]|nr:VOC family protein [Candidatus Methanomethylophilaceae archaeon]